MNEDFKDLFMMMAGAIIGMGCGAIVVALLTKWLFF